MIITRKIELRVIGDEDKKTANWKYLRELENVVYKSANLIVSNQYFNRFFSERIVLTDEELSDGRKKLEKEIEGLKEKLKNVTDEKEIEKIKREKDKKWKSINSLTKEAREKAVEFYTTSEQNTTYRMIVKMFPDLSSYVAASLNHMINKYFNNEIFDVQNGKRALRTYRKGMPIPFEKKSLRFEKVENDYILHWINKIDFAVNFGRDRSNNKIILERILNNSYSYGDSSIQIKNKKIFLLLVVKMPDEEKPKLNKNLCVGVDLGINIPAYCALSEGHPRLPIGSREDFLKIRTHMQSRRKRLQKALALVKGGKGRGKKLKGMEILKTKERNFVRTYNHNVSSKIVKFALDNFAGVIKLELLEGFSEDEKNNFILRNWSYYELQSMLEYKAKREGIEIKYIDPYHTSQTCAVCGHYEQGQRTEQEKFVCKNPDCKNSDNADYNASLNIAKSDKYVEKKEDCMYFKNNNNKK
jgi:putative transposase